MYALLWRDVKLADRPLRELLRFTDEERRERLAQEARQEAAATHGWPAPTPRMPFPCDGIGVMRLPTLTCPAVLRTIRQVGSGVFLSCLWDKS